MSFLLPCPHCGPRDVYEFRFGGERVERPAPDAPREAWVDYLYFRANPHGAQVEWWYHRVGCHAWFLAERDLRDNTVIRTAPPHAFPGP